MQDLIYAILLVVVCWLCYYWGRIDAARELTRMIQDGRLLELLDPGPANSDQLELEKTAEGIFAYSQEGQFVAWAPDWPQLLQQLEINCGPKTIKLNLDALDLEPEERARVKTLIEQRNANDSN